MYDNMIHQGLFLQLFHDMIMVRFMTYNIQDKFLNNIYFTSNNYIHKIKIINKFNDTFIETK